MNTNGNVFSSNRTTKRRNTWSCSRSISIIRSATRSSRARWAGRSCSTRRKATPGAMKWTRCWRRNRPPTRRTQRIGEDASTFTDGFEDHTLYRAAFALTVWIDQLFDEQAALQNEPAAVKLATHSALASAKLAAALSDDDVDEIGMTIAYLKRALKAITVSMEAGAQLLSEQLITPAPTCRSPATPFRGPRRNYHPHGAISRRMAPALRQPLSRLE